MNSLLLLIIIIIFQRIQKMICRVDLMHQNYLDPRTLLPVNVPSLIGGLLSILGAILAFFLIGYCIFFYLSFVHYTADSTSLPGLNNRHTESLVAYGFYQSTEQTLATLVKESGQIVISLQMFDYKMYANGGWTNKCNSSAITTLQTGCSAANDICLPKYAAFPRFYESSF